MTDLEHQFLKQLITAAWPLYWQIAFALGLMISYYGWSIVFYRLVDASWRSFIGRALGVRLIWVLRHSNSYQTSFELGLIPTRYYRWSWGIEMEHQRTFLRDGAVWLLSLLMVNVLSSLWPMAIFYYVFISLQALSYLVFLPTCIAMIIIYAAFWSGRYEVKGMR
jgi:hypothetical protein